MSEVVVEAAPRVARARQALARHALGLPGLAILGLFFVVPLLRLVSLSARRPSGAFTLFYYREVLTGHVYHVTFLRSITAAVVLLAISLPAGYAYALALARRGRWLRFAGLAVAALPLLLNALVVSFVWLVIIQRNGALNWLIRHLDLGSVDLYQTRTGALLGMEYVVLPLVIFPIFAAVSAVDPKIYDAARVLGARSSTIFFRVTLPLTLNGAAAGAVLVFVTTFGIYLIPEILGGPQYTMLPYLIQQDATQYLEWHLASAIAVLFLVGAVPLLVLAQYLLGRTVRMRPR